MGLFDWLKRKETNSAAAPVGDVQFEKNEEVFAGLNMKEAIDAHLAWRKRLEAAIADQSIAGYEIGTVASDNQCKLGKWLGQDAKRFAMMPEYQNLRRAHAEFHLVAGEILAEIRDGSYESAAGRIRGDLRHHSDQVQLNLIRLCTKANYGSNSLN